MTLQDSAEALQMSSTVAETHWSWYGIGIFCSSAVAIGTFARSDPSVQNLTEELQV